MCGDPAATIQALESLQLVILAGFNELNYSSCYAELTSMAGIQSLFLVTKSKAVTGRGKRPISVGIWVVVS